MNVDEIVYTQQHLKDACVNGDIETFQQCVAYGLPLHDEHAHFKDTPIFHCCYNGHLQLLKCIVEREADVLFQSAVGDIGECPLLEHTVVWNELQKVASEGKNGLIIGICLLYLACIFRDIHIIKFLAIKLTSASVSPLIKASGLKQPFYVACTNNDHETARLLLEMNMAKITGDIAEQFPMIMIALLQGRSYVKPCSSIKASRKKKNTTFGKATMRNTFKRTTMKKSVREPVKDKVMISWDGLNLHTLHRNWLRSLQSGGMDITNIDLSGNGLTALPEDFFASVPNIEELNVARNSLYEIPIEGLHTAKLINFTASQNQLTSLPFDLFLNRTLQNLDVSLNGIEQLPSAPYSIAVEISGSIKEGSKKHHWKCSSLETFTCSRNLLKQLPKAMQGATGLLNLYLSHNRFSDFDLVWKCPLTLLDLSHNPLERFSGRVESVWSRTLQTLKLSHNKFTFIPTGICHLQNLQKLNLSHNSLTTLPHPDIWKCKILSSLNLSNNELSTRKLSDGFMDIQTGELQYDRTCELPVKLFSRTMQYLNLSYNKLEEVPSSVCELKLLSQLDLSNNSELHHLPASLGLLSNIWFLGLTNLDIPNIPFRLDDFNQATKVLPFLRAKFRKSVPFNRIKLMVVGLERRGKTSLVAALQEKPLPDDISTVGISIEQFSLPLKSSLSIDVLWIASSEPEIMFSTWDLAGQQVYYATHQCFLTSNTLYLVVFNITHGNEGIESLKPWLLNIQARAPNSQCIIVGTHTDCLPKDYKQTAIEKYRNDIMKKYTKKKGFPHISGYVFVSSVTRENMDQLRSTIYSIANEMINKNSHQSDFGKTAPLSYLQLYDRVIKEAHHRRTNRQAPVLTTDEMLQLAQENPDNDIFEGEELCSAARFLHENGILLHFDDPLRGLSTLFFIDPSWLIDMLALVVTVKERNPFVRDGYIEKEKMMVILNNPRLPVTFIPQYLRLLERFEIALCIDDARFLIPCMLPIERPDIGDRMQHVITDKEIDGGKVSKERMSKYLTRNYHMNYIPAGFWSRLVARLVIAVQEWDSNVTDSSQENTNHRCWYTVWKKGIFVVYDDGYFLLEDFLDDIVDYQDSDLSNQGMSITVWSKTQNFRVMGFIVDHVDMLISDWYPGLAEGDRLIQRIIACPMCSLRLQEAVISSSELDINEVRNNYGSLFRDPTTVQQFPLPMCATAMDHQARSIYCAKHPNQPVPLELIIPDIMLTDIPKEYKIEQDYFDFDPSEENRLGSGGAAKVFKANYKGVKVAVKQFHSQGLKTRKTRSELPKVFVPDEDCVYEDECKVIKGIWELRQEVLVLCTLQHPNVIKFLGVCHSPLCFVIELAPMGSLQTVIDKRVKQRRLNNLDAPTNETEWFPALFERRITRNIALQVIEAIKYLHMIHSIIYRDLKSDNILVWSLNEEDTVNVKISDYGIAAFATPQGVVGDVGTPGFQAPEVKYETAYDEKVDIFAYGMWLYQLMTGYTPFHEYTTNIEIKKALLSGVRPNLQKDCIKPKIPNMELLMENCWHHNPMLRPSANEISTFLTYPDSCMMESLYPPSSAAEASMIHDITCFTHWNVQRREELTASESILVWMRAGDERMYRLIDVNDEICECEGMVSGPRVSYACQVEDNVWLANQDNEIEVFGVFKSQPPKVLWKFTNLEDEVIMMETHKTENFLTVFGCSANGTLNIFKKYLRGTQSSTQPHFESTEDYILTFQKDCWANHQVIKVNNIGAPSKCMTITRNNKELWVGSSDTIVIVNLMDDVHDICARLKSCPNSNSIVSCMVGDGERHVWVCNWRNTFVVKWDVEMRTRVCEYQCNVINPLNEVLLTEVGTGKSIVEQRALSFDDSIFQKYHHISATIDVDGASCVNADTTNNGNNIGLVKESSDSSNVVNNSVQSNNNISNNDILPPQRVGSFLKFPNRTMKRTYRSKSVNLNGGLLAPDGGNETRYSSFARRIKSLNYVNDTLWIGRAIGDILVVSTGSLPNAAEEGKVLTVLVDDSLGLMGGYARSVHSVIPMENKMAVLIRKNARIRQRSVRDRSMSESSVSSGTNPNDTFQLIVYGAWDAEEIVEFNQNTVKMTSTS